MVSQPIALLKGTYHQMSKFLSIIIRLIYAITSHTAHQSPGGHFTHESLDRWRSQTPLEADIRSSATQARSILVAASVPSVAISAGSSGRGTSGTTAPEITAMIHSVFDPLGGTALGDLAVRIATCESSLRPTARVRDFDGAWATGLFQIHEWLWGHWAHIDPATLTDPMVNIQLAAKIWQYEGGTFKGQWACA